MADDRNIFISWSGERSKKAAEALREWLPTVLQASKPWMSDSDIEKGSRGLDEVANALGNMKVGIICLTPENLKEEWILFEAGALSKTLDAKTRVCTYLLAGLQPQGVKPPLGTFQATKAEKEDTRKLVHSIRTNLDIDVSESVVNNTFDKMWPDLEAKLLTLPKPPGAAPPKRPLDEMVAEILELDRIMAPEVREIAHEASLTRQERKLKQALAGLRAPGSGRAAKWAELVAGVVNQTSPGTAGFPSETYKVDPTFMAQAAAAEATHPPADPAAKAAKEAQIEQIKKKLKNSG